MAIRYKYLTKQDFKEILYDIRDNDLFLFLNFRNPVSFEDQKDQLVKPCTYFSVEYKRLDNYGDIYKLAAFSDDLEDPYVTSAEFYMYELEDFLLTIQEAAGGYDILTDGK